MQSPAQLDKLERLATFLETKVDAKRFNISSWGSTVKADDPTYTGCAAGYGTVVFNGEGFKLHHAKTGVIVTYQNADGLEATRKFFGVESEDNHFLFTGTGGAGTDPRKAAKNIRDVIKKVKLANAAKNNDVIAWNVFN